MRLWFVEFFFLVLVRFVTWEALQAAVQAWSLQNRKIVNDVFHCIAFRFRRQSELSSCFLLFELVHAWSIKLMELSIILHLSVLVQTNVVLIFSETLGRIDEHATKLFMHKSKCCL